MRIALHDYAGHGFIAELSRSLARRGHQVDHYYAAQNPTPRGDLDLAEVDPEGLTFIPVSIAQPFQKYYLIRRWLQEREYGKALVRAISSRKPEVLLSAQAPLDTQLFLSRFCDQEGIAEVLWIQDLIGVAAKQILSSRIPLFGSLIGSYFQALQLRILQRSKFIIVIAPNFADLLGHWGINAPEIHVIPNWAAIEKISPGLVANPWSRRHGLDNVFSFLYAGTLGFKHNPELLLRLAEEFRDFPDVRVVVVSEGPGGTWLRNEVDERKIENLLVLPFQSMADLSDVLASGEVLVAILEPGAGDYSVPSKVLSYFCAQRPVLASIHRDNLASRTIEEQRAGLVVPPGQIEDFVAAAIRLFQEPFIREELGVNGRQFAEDHFQLDSITDRFEDILARAVSKSKRAEKPPGKS